VKKRLFVAVDLPADVRVRVAAYARELRLQMHGAPVSWTKPENLHLTVKFLGDVDQRMFDNVIRALATAGTSVSPFHLSITGTGVFPATRKPKVLWLGVSDPAGRLGATATALDDALSRLGSAKEDRVFSPHLTLGRIRDAANGREVAQKHLMRDFDPAEFYVTEIVLYESQLSRAGSVYTPISKAKLAC
jgi:RNA 2',3'-cyclic 3'-phosphodiesterase